MGLFDSIAKIGGDIIDGAAEIASDAADAVVDVAEGAGKGIGSAAEWSADQIETGAGNLFDFGSDAFDWTKGAFSDGADWTGEAFSDAWDWTEEAFGDAGEYIWDRGTAAIYGFGDGLWQAGEGAWLNITEGVGRFTRGFSNAAEGDWGEAFDDWGTGLAKTFVQTPVDALAMAGGRAVSGVQTIVGLEPEGRELTADEIAALRSVYGDSIDYDKIIIKEGDAGLMGLGGRPFTHGNVIYIPEDKLPLTRSLLIHETAHVWQHQNGGNDYMSDAMLAQNFGEGYDWKQYYDAGGRSFADMNPEQQAELIEMAYKAGYFTGGVPPEPIRNSDGTTDDGSDFDLATHGVWFSQELEKVRAGKGAA